MSAGKVRYKEVAATIVFIAITLFLLMSATGYTVAQDVVIKANFTADQTSGPSPLTVQFTDLSQGTITAWEWDFGDSTAHSNDQNPSHIYDNPGSYSVTLTVWGNYNDSSSVDEIQQVNFINVVVVTPTPTATAVPSPSPSPLPTTNPGTGGGSAGSGGSTGNGGSNEYGINGTGPETTTPTPTAVVNTSAGYVSGNPSVSLPPQSTTPGPTTAASGSQVTGRSPYSISNPTLIILAVLSAIVIAVLLMFFISGKGQGAPKKKDDELTPDYLYKLVTGEDATKAQKPEQERIPINDYKKKK